MLFKEKIQRLFLWYRKYRHYVLVFSTKQGQWNQMVAFARRTFPKLLIYLQMLSLKTVNLQVSKWNQMHCHPTNVQICRTVLWAPLSHSFQPTRCCQSQHHHCSRTSMTVSIAAVMMAPRPPLTPNSSTLWTQEPGWGTTRTCPAEQAPLTTLVSGHAVPCHAQPSQAWRGSLGAAWAQQQGTELGCGRGGAGSSQFRFPCLSKPHPQAAFQKGWVQGKAHQIRWFKPHVEQALSAFFYRTTAEEPGLWRTPCPLTFRPAHTPAPLQLQEQAPLPS